MRLRFRNQDHRRFYEGSIAELPAVAATVMEYFLDALGVLGAARSHADFAGLAAFKTFLLDAGPPERRAMSLGPEWTLVFSIDGDNSDDAVATIESLQKARPAARRGK